MSRPHPFQFGEINFVCCVCLKPLPSMPTDGSLTPTRRVRMNGKVVDVIIGMHASCAESVGTNMAMRAAEEAGRQMAWEAVVQLN